MRYFNRNRLYAYHYDCTKRKLYYFNKYDPIGKALYIVRWGNGLRTRFHAVNGLKFQNFKSRHGMYSIGYFAWHS